MEKKKKGVMQSIPGWAWVLISLAAAILLWYALSINPKTARSCSRDSGFCSLPDPETQWKG